LESDGGDAPHIYTTSAMYIVSEIPIGTYEVGENTRGGDADMPQGTAHERMRFRQMTERQLWTRLGKITTHEKLQNFASMAREFRYEALAIASEAKLKVYRGEFNLSLSNKPEEKTRKASGTERLLRRINK